MTEAQRNRYNELNRELLYCDGEEFPVLYAEYKQLAELERKEFRESNEKSLREYYEKYIEGRTWEELREYWDFYSDYHKDVYGYRPRSISINARNI